MARLGINTATWHPLADMTPEEQQREAARLDYDALITDAADRLKHQVDLGKMVIQSLILVNGGAIVALFTLVGKQGANLPINPSSLTTAFGYFIAGLVCALASGFAGFLSQYWYALTSTMEAWQKQAEMMGQEYTGKDYNGTFVRGSIAIGLGLLLAAGALICFGLGSRSALIGVLGQHT